MTYNHVQVPREKSVLQDTAVGNINPLTFVRHDNYSSTEGDIASEVDISSHGQMVQLKNTGNLFESLLELLDLPAELVRRH
jgi:hypothetical protein